MPFQSQKQRSWMYANKPAMAKRWEADTPKGKKLPMKKDSESKKHEKKESKKKEKSENKGKRGKMDKAAEKNFFKSKYSK